MTQDDIIRMAWEAGLEREDDDSGEWSVYDDELLKFARKIVAAEREACADLVQHLRQSIREAGIEAYAMKDALDQAEAAIRASGGKGRV